MQDFVREKERGQSAVRQVYYSPYIEQVFLESSEQTCNPEPFSQNSLLASSCSFTDMRLISSFAISLSERQQNVCFMVCYIPPIISTSRILSCAVCYMIYVTCLHVVSFGFDHALVV